MIETLLRDRYQRMLVDRFAIYLEGYVKPIHVTMLGLILGLSIPVALFAQKIFLACTLLLISGYCDTLDGALARLGHQCSDFGTALDIVADRCVEFAVVFGLWLVDPLARSFSCIFMLGSILICVTSFLVVGILTPNHSNKNFYYSPGIIERSEAFLFFILMILLPNDFAIFSGLFCFLVFMTTILRMYEFSKKNN